MGDRRISDRRAKEEGVIKIKKERFYIYAVFIGLLVLAICLNIYSWSAYIRYRKQYYTLIDNYYNGNTPVTDTAATIKENNNYTCNVSIKSDKESIKQGETITYEIKASNINARKGIKTFETYIDYDSGLFNCNVESDSKGNWTKTAFIEGYLTMNKSNLEASAEDQVIAKVSFKANQGIKAGRHSIKFKNIKLTTDDDSLIDISDYTLDIKID